MCKADRKAIHAVCKIFNLESNTQTSPSGLYVCVFVYVCLCVRDNLSVRIRGRLVCAFECLCLNSQVCVCVYVLQCLCVCVQAFVVVCVCVCLSLCVYDSECVRVREKEIYLNIQSECSYWFFCIIVLWGVPTFLIIFYIQTIGTYILGEKMIEMKKPSADKKAQNRGGINHVRTFVFLFKLQQLEFGV